MRRLIAWFQRRWNIAWSWTRDKWYRFRAWAVSVLTTLGLITVATTLGWADDANISWINAEFYENGDPMPLSEIAETVIYKQTFPLGTDISAAPRSYVELVRVTPSVTSHLDADLPNGIHCYVGTHVATNGVESAYSGEACKTIDVRLPGAPQSFQVN